MKIDKKGFTLVEIMTVIGIIALILVILIPSTIAIQNSINKRTYQTKKEIIEKTAKLYVEENANKIKHEINSKLTTKACNKSEEIEGGNGCLCENGTCRYVYKITLNKLIELDLYKKENKAGCQITNPEDNTCLDDVPMTFYIDGDRIYNGDGDTLDYTSLDISLELEAVDITTGSIKVKLNITGPDVNKVTKYYYSIDGKEYMETNINTYEFTNLAPGTSYKIKAYVKNNANTESEIVEKEFKTGGTAFNITIPEYGKIKITDVPANYKIKYAVGNRDQTYFEKNGTDITSSLSFIADDNIYTIALLNASDKILATKKYYIHNTGDLEDDNTFSGRIYTPNINKIIGNAISNDGSAEVILTNNYLTINATGANYYTKDTRETDECKHTQELYCPNGGDLSGDTCVGSSYEVWTKYSANNCSCDTSISCKTHVEGNNNMDCPDGYTYANAKLEDNGSYYDVNCRASSDPKNPEYNTIIKENTWYQFEYWTADCIWNGNYDAHIEECEEYYTETYYYYHYTIGVEIN